MNKLLIITSSRSSPGANKLLNAAVQLGVDCFLEVIGEDSFLVNIAATDTVLYRIAMKSYPILCNLQPTLSSPHKENLAHVLEAFDKDATYGQLVLNDIDTPISYRLLKNDTPKEYPVIIKILHGNQGRGIDLINSDEDYRHFVKQYPDEPVFLAQEYIEEANASDKRLIIVRDKFITAVKRRSNSGDFRANLHTGGLAESYAPTDEEIHLAIKATKSFGLLYAGVDIIDSKRGPLVLEVNPSPGFAISDITRVDVPLEIMKGIM